MDALTQLQQMREREVFNTDCLPADALVICGSRDMAEEYIAAGFVSVISFVPTGADTSILDPYIEDIISSASVYLALQNEEATKSLSGRIGREKCFLVEVGSNPIDSIEGARPMPIEGVEYIQDVMEEAYSYLINGYPETYYIDIPGFDGAWSMYLPEVTIVTGSPGAGKSNMVDLIAVEAARLHGFKSAILSAEKSHGIHTAGLARKYMKKEELSQADVMHSLEWLNDNIAYIKGKEQKFNGISAGEGLHSIESTLLTMRQLVISRGFNILIIDNLSTMSDRPARGEDDTAFAARIMGQLTGFSRYYNVHIILVAHPKKQTARADGYFDLPNGYDVLGSSHYYNLVDNIISMAKREGNEVEVGTRKIRNAEFVGKIARWNLYFNKENGGTYTLAEHKASSWGHTTGVSLTSFLNDD